MSECYFFSSFSHTDTLSYRLKCQIFFLSYNFSLPPSSVRTIFSLLFSHNLSLSSSGVRYRFFSLSHELSLHTSLLSYLDFFFIFLSQFFFLLRRLLINFFFFSLSLKVSLSPPHQARGKER